MTDPTPIKALLAERFEEITERRRQERDEPPVECWQHPGNPLDDCGACEEDRTAERLRQEREWRADLVVSALADVARRFPARYRSTGVENADVLAWVKAFTAHPDDAPSLLLLGSTGVGKTWHAYGALALAIQAPVTSPAGMPRAATWASMTYADLCASLRPRGNTDTEAELARLRKLDLLLVDDLGAAKASEWVEETTYRLINGRYEDMRSSIFTSNLSLPELKAAVGDRIASRLAETCERVVLTGPDRRRQTKPAGTKEADRV